MNLQQLYLALLVGGLVLLASIVGTRVATRVGFPSLLLFLLFGVLLGEDGLGLEFDDVELARNIGTAALAVILVEGGLTTRYADIRKVLAPAGALATVGVFDQHGGDRGGCACAASAWTGSSRCCWARSSPRPTPPRSSRFCGCFRCPGGWPVSSRPSPVSTTHPPSFSC